MLQHRLLILRHLLQSFRHHRPQANPTTDNHSSCRLHFRDRDGVDGWLESGRRHGRSPTLRSQQHLFSVPRPLAGSKVDALGASYELAAIFHNIHSFPHNLVSLPRIQNDAGNLGYLGPDEHMAQNLYNCLLHTDTCALLAELLLVHTDRAKRLQNGQRAEGSQQLEQRAGNERVFIAQHRRK